MSTPSGNGGAGGGPARRRIVDVPKEEEAADGGVKGALGAVSGALGAVTSFWQKNPAVVKVRGYGEMLAGGTWKATKMVGEYAWVVGATAVVVVVPLMLEMEREATFQLQAELMQKQVLDIQRGTPATGAAP